MANSIGALTGRAGVYEIVNVINGKRYIGSAISIQDRFGMHRRDLDRGNHPNRHLQSAWRKYGRDGFKFRAILICAGADVVRYEQLCIDAFKPEFNICKSVTRSRLGLNNSPEHSRKIGAANKGKKRDPAILQAMSERGKRQAALGLIKPPPAMPLDVKARVDADKIGRKQPGSAVALRAALAKERMRDPEFKARAVACLRSAEEKRKTKAAAACKTAEYRAAASNRIKALWADPDFRAKTMAASKAVQDNGWKLKHAAGIARHMNALRHPSEPSDGE